MTNQPRMFKVWVSYANGNGFTLESSFSCKGDAWNRANALQSILNEHSQSYREIRVTDADDRLLLQLNAPTQTVAEELGEHGIATDDAPLVNTLAASPAGQKMIALHLAHHEMNDLLRSAGMIMPDQLRCDLYDLMLDACGLIELNHKSPKTPNELLPLLSR